MRTHDELNWLLQDHDDFASETGDPILSFILEVFSLSFSSVSDVGFGSPSEVSVIDAVVAGDTIVRVWTEPSAVHIGTLASEDSADQSWVEQSFSLGEVVGSISLNSIFDD